MSKVEKNAQDVILNIVNGKILDGRILIGNRLYSLEELKEYIAVNFDQKRKSVKLCEHREQYEAYSFTEYKSSIDKVVVKKLFSCKNCSSNFYEETYRDVSP